MNETAVDTLPDDVATVKALLHTANKKIHSLQQLLHAYQEEKRLAAARQFAPSSEKDAVQYRLFDEAEYGADDTTVNEDIPTTEVNAHQRRGRRKPLPAGLPRIEIIHDLPDDEKHCTENDIYDDCSTVEYLCFG